MIPSVKTSTVIGMLAFMIGSGTVFFRWAEGWSWLDAYFFTVVTLSTVGYGSLVPVTTIGKLGATIYILSGLGIFAFAISHFGQLAIQRRLKQIQRKKAQQGEDPNKQSDT